MGELDDAGGGIWAEFASSALGDRSTALFELSEGLVDAQEPKLALEAALAAVESAQSESSARLEAQAWMLAGQVRVTLKDLDSAQDAFTRAAELWGSDFSWRKRGHCLIAAFDCARRTGRDAEFTPMIEEAYALVVGVDDWHASAYAATRLARRRLDDGKPTEALDLLNEARRWAGDDTDMVMLINDAEATVRIALGNTERAVALLVQAFDLGETSSGGSFPLYEAWRLVVGLRLSGDVAGALALATAGLDAALAEHPTDPDVVGCFHLEIARSQRALGRVSAAAVSLRKSYSHLIISSNAIELAECERELTAWGIESAYEVRPLIRP